MDVSKPKFRRRKDTRPGELIAAAIEEFSEHGYGDARLARIATRAGVSNGTLYHYFEDKAALFSAVVDKVFLSPLDQQTQPSGEVPDDPLMLAIESVLTDEMISIVAILLFEAQRYPDPVGAIAERFLSNVEARLRQAMSGFVETSYPLSIILLPLSCALVERARRKPDWKETARRAARAHLDLVRKTPG